mmetsp:Transcript_13385/g.24569  ORF Transcript_13385/g.24569 Transcript_13385/m.24569 type:complete len:208 (-) Transcript_13385:2420-3043(-)
MVADASVHGSLVRQGALLIVVNSVKVSFVLAGTVKVAALVDIRALVHVARHLGVEVGISKLVVGESGVLGLGALIVVVLHDESIRDFRVLLPCVIIVVLDLHRPKALVRVTDGHGRRSRVLNISSLIGVCPFLPSIHDVRVVTELPSREVSISNIRVHPGAIVVNKLYLDVACSSDRHGVPGNLHLLVDVENRRIGNFSLPSVTVLL